MRQPRLTIKHLGMKKIKIMLSSIAITIAITGAFATRFCMHNHQTQYIPLNDTYKPVGDFGTDYNCVDSQNVCTFFQPDSVACPKEYLPYRKGQFVPIRK
jgi:hypothetical protein